MYIIAYILVTLTAAGLTMLIRASTSAPEALEDAQGFHLVDAQQAVGLLEQHGEVSIQGGLFSEKELSAHWC